MSSVIFVCKQLKKMVVVLSAVSLMGGVANANLLSNGDFNSPNSTAPPDSWNLWTFGGGWANHEFPMLVDNGQDNTGNYDGSYQMSLGGFENAGGGVYQIVAATAGTEYQLSVDAGAQAWWLPTGEVRLFFLDAADAELASTVIKTTDSIHDPDIYDVGVVYQPWSLSATAPAGTTQAKVEFANPNGTGSAWFDNASLTVVPEPASLALAGLASVALLCGSRRRDR
ncbi:PEP-CTERM sorting domain-containing protein [Bythopirellula goksoeyrii]|uniref:Ice-binding protein C-terminal domain-containing protein n=1 Tax=Bythopirellula goksoeyrii TaxID=1400387 RepID=A0A5B9QHT7_9BACT|nr:PEP-CTERM sorting domain-containing protein [Bythopirellula goksoeyrii]QEG36556.1 hypothetical protein Pr1d_38700 [Bythopirellula goksoeyrii]